MAKPKLIEDIENLQTLTEGHTSQLDDIAVNVKSFGAKGDGTTDDTIAINNTLAYAKANNLKEVYIPKGTFIVNGEGTPSYNYKNGGIIIDFSVTLRLHSEAIIKQKTSSQDGYQIIDLKNASNITITGGTILGDVDTHNGTTGEQGCGIYLYNSKNITIDGVTISKCWGDGINADFQWDNGTITNDNITIKNCVFDTNRRQGITVSSVNNFYIYNNVFKNTGSLHGTLPMSGIDIEGYPGVTFSKNVIIQGNEFENNIGADVIISNDCDGVKILHNTMKTTSIGINFATNVVGIKNVIVEGNTIDGATVTTGQGTGIFINMQDGKGIIISKNIIKNFTNQIYAAGIDYAGTGDKVNLIGNTISNCYFGISANTTSPNLAIESNIIYDILDIGIRYANFSQNNIVTNNIITNCATYGIKYGGINGVVTGNLIKLTQKAGIMLFGCQNNVIGSNTLIDFCQAVGNTEAGIYNQSSSSYSNYIHSNLFKNTNSIIAIKITATPSGSPNIVRGNVARYVASAISVDANCISDSNYTV